jgi:hypothetical protein
MGRGR